MKIRLSRLLAGVLGGAAIFVGAIWVLSKTLGDAQSPKSYAGNTIDSWRQQLYGHNAAVSNATFAVVDSQVIPQLVDAMFHDTNDSAARLSFIGALNQLPSVQINVMEAAARRAFAAQNLGDLGPAARSAVPDLAKAMLGDDVFVKGAAIQSLGEIHSDAQVVIPLLLPFLDDENLNQTAVAALAEYGTAAKAAVPKVITMLHSREKDDRAAARAALPKIDPEAAAREGIKISAAPKAR